MLYRITRSVVRLGIRGFFNKIEAYGADQLNIAQPIIIIANHPSALIDPLVIATITDRKLHFLAAAEYFGKGLLKRLLHQEFNMIPVYRPNLYEGQEVSNEDMFRDCYKCLDKNGCIVIFPEGNSVTEKHLRPLKTGTARILMGYKKLRPNKEIQVIPLGINYTSAHQFQSDVFVSIGEPVPLTFDLNDESEESIKQEIQSITNKLHEALKSEILNFDQKDLESLVGSFLQVGNTPLFNEPLHLKKDTSEKFRREQKIISAVEYLHQTNPSKVTNLQTEINSFLDNLNELNLEPGDLGKAKGNFLPIIVKLIIFLPFAMFGLFCNWVPYVISKYLFLNKFKPKVTDYEVKGGLSPAFVATLAYSTGTVVFLIWMLAISIALSIGLFWWVGLIFFFGSSYLGRLTLRYMSWFGEIKTRIITARNHRRLGQTLITLNKQRNDLIQKLSALIKEYESYSHQNR